MGFVLPFEVAPRKLILMEDVAMPWVTRARLLFCFFLIIIQTFSVLVKIINFAFRVVFNVLHYITLQT